MVCQPAHSIPSFMSPSLLSFATHPRPGGVSPVQLIEIGWRLSFGVRPSLVTAMRLPRLSQTFASRLIRGCLTISYETINTCYIHSFRHNAVSIIHFGSEPTTTKSLCAPRLSMTVTLLQECCSRHNFTEQSMTRL